MTAGSRVIDTLARRRVQIGFVVAVAALILAKPAWATWRAGALVACLGEGFRIWAAGHLEKGREVTRSGPYRFTGHPLYVGSFIIAAGVIIACGSAAVAGIAMLYMILTIGAAVRSEELQMRRTFGELYDRYREARAEPMPRRFSLARARRNREYRAIVGLTVGFGLLAVKLIILGPRT